MRHALGRALLLVTVTVASAGAQGRAFVRQAGAPAHAKLTWTDLRGKWVGTSMAMTSDSVITTFSLTVSPERKVAMDLPNRSAVRATVVAMAGDSLVVDCDPYQSVSRPGNTVRVHAVLHVRAQRMTGSFTSVFEDGEHSEGRVEAAHHR